MFPAHAFTRDWLLRQSKQMGACAPQVLEKCLHALTLLGHLVETGLPLVFRGGTSLRTPDAEPEFAISVERS